MNVKPFLKWAGGKSQLLETLNDNYPDFKNGKIEYYYEPFLGSGAVFFDLVKKHHIKYSILCDINPELIITYKVIQENVDTLINYLLEHEKSYIKLDKEKRRMYFLKQREIYNTNKSKIDFNKYSVEWCYRAAQFIFLNKTCFNGLYRVNLRGEFNTPPGDYKNPNICDSNNLKSVSSCLKNSEILNADFRNINYKNNSFVYFDPPYRPISKSSNFNSYNKEGFSDDDQIALFKLFEQLNEREIKILLSNSDPKNYNENDHFFDSLYNHFSIARIKAKRMINSKGNSRGHINELLIKNY